MPYHDIESRPCQSTTHLLHHSIIQCPRQLLIDTRQEGRDLVSIAPLPSCVPVRIISHTQLGNGKPEGVQVQVRIIQDVLLELERPTDDMPPVSTRDSVPIRFQQVFDLIRVKLFQNEQLDLHGQRLPISSNTRLERPHRASLTGVQDLFDSGYS